MGQVFGEDTSDMKYAAYKAFMTDTSGRDELMYSKIRSRVCFATKPVEKNS